MSSIDPIVPGGVATIGSTPIEIVHGQQSEGEPMTHFVGYGREAFTGTHARFPKPHFRPEFVPELA